MSIIIIIVSISSGTIRDGDGGRLRVQQEGPGGTRCVRRGLQGTTQEGKYIRSVLLLQNYNIYIFLKGAHKQQAAPCENLGQSLTVNNADLQQCVGCYHIPAPCFFLMMHTVFVFFYDACSNR